MYILNSSRQFRINLEYKILIWICSATALVARFAIGYIRQLFVKPPAPSRRSWCGGAVGTVWPNWYDKDSSRWDAQQHVRDCLLGMLQNCHIFAIDRGSSLTEFIPKRNPILRAGFVQIRSAHDADRAASVLGLGGRNIAHKKTRRCANTVEIRVYARIGLKVAQEIASKRNIFGVVSSGAISKSAKRWFDKCDVKYRENFPLYY